MFNKMFTGKITSVSAGAKIETNGSGEKERFEIYKVKLESDDIDYDSLTEFNSAIASTLLNIQPMPFLSVDFGDQTTINTSVMFSEIESENVPYCEAQFIKVMITNLTVKSKEDIPKYVFTLEIPLQNDGKFLFSHIKSNVNFKFIL